MKITVIGTGFVGVVTAAVFSSFNNQVWGLDIDQAKVDSLNQGQVPFHEPQLTELLQQQLASGNLQFTTSYPEAIAQAEVIMVAVGTPSAPDGTADTKYVEAACQSLAKHLADGTIVAIKSTVPPGIFDKLTKIIASHTDKNFVLVSLPEFLREGSAVADTLHPDRVVIGCTDQAAIEKLTKLHQPLAAPVVTVKPESAQMGKYSANAYLAQRITFINQIADLCEQNGARVDEVIQIIGEDKRIGSHYWYPGLGYGGSCFPKDVRELAAYSRKVGQGNNLFNKIHELNEDRIYQKMREFGEYCQGWSDRTVAVLGLSFKPQTDDLRVAPSTKVIPYLLHEGAKIQAYDPMANEMAAKVLPSDQNLKIVDSLEAALEQAEIMILLIEWPELVSYPYHQLPAQINGRNRTMIDVRNQLQGELLQQAGWKYISIGQAVLNSKEGISDVQQSVS